jgi:hypothetical protein
MYRDLVECVTPQVDEFITVAHGPVAQAYATGVTIPYDADDLDLSAMWNLGLDKAAELAAGAPFYVAGFNDDALVAPDWFDRMVEAVERDGAAGASTPRDAGKPKSIFGGAWMVKGGIRLSGVFRWYHTDDEIQKLCQAAGGFSIVEGVYAVNRLVDQSYKDSPYLRAVSSEDGPKFISMYGLPESPWA